MTQKVTKTRTKRWCAALVATMMLAALLCLPPSRFRPEPIDFHQAIELALKHSGVMLAASADRARAAKPLSCGALRLRSYHHLRGPPGDSLGIPVTVAGQVPSLYNVVHNQTLFNLAARETIKAAHSDSIAASMEYADRGEQVILDTALLYIELDNTAQRLDAARKQKEAVNQAFYIAQQRLQEGVGSCWTASAPNWTPPALTCALPNWRRTLTCCASVLRG